MSPGFPFRHVVHVAGVIDQDEADLLVGCGVDWIGFPFRLDVHREDLTEAAAASIVRGLPSTTRAVLITYLDMARDIAALATELGVGAVQAHGPIDVEELAALRELAPDLILVKSLVVREGRVDGLLAAAERFAPHVDAFLTDSHDPATGATGATGRTHDWSVSARLVESTSRPVILAGGLDPANVADAIARVRPAAVDAHTKLEGADGRKRRDLVETFVANARKAFAALR